MTSLENRGIGAIKTTSKTKLLLYMDVQESTLGVGYFLCGSFDTLGLRILADVQALYYSL